MPRCLRNKVLDQAVKYIEDLQEDFDFRYKTLQSRGELCFLRFHTARKTKQNTHALMIALLFVYMCACVSVRLDGQEL